MEIYLVGGSVRDFLLLHQQHAFLTEQEEQRYWNSVEKDWVVVGATPDEMIAKGYRQVGKSFPVFLHPLTHEEYALARTERKIGKGYTGFECYASPEVTLEEDLQRRDLTINAIAMRIVDDRFRLENIIDPHGGIQDLQKKIFRHVANAFVEDPVRILRIARFACRFEDFVVAPETVSLMKLMVEAGEIDALVPERVWQEWRRSLKEKAPWRWFEVLEQCGAKTTLFVDLQNITLKKQALKLAIEQQFDDLCRFTIEVFDLERDQLRSLVKIYRIPNEYSDLAFLVNKFYCDYLQTPWTPQSLLQFFEKTDALRRPVRFREFVKIANLLATVEGHVVVVPDFEQLLAEILSIDTQALLAAGFKGALFAQELRKIRLKALEKRL